MYICYTDMLILIDLFYHSKTLNFHIASMYIISSFRYQPLKFRFTFDYFGEMARPIKSCVCHPCNNNDNMCIANIVLNEVPNTNDAMRIANNVCLTTMHGQTMILNGGYIAIMQKSRLTIDER